MTTRKSRGLRLSDDAMAKLKRLQRATGYAGYQLVEAMVNEVYQGYREEPQIGPALRALEHADAALAGTGTEDSAEPIQLIWPQRRQP